eukprot:CAMPEP_0204600930 /NCGR_PEP_ID=MMETSP0661-20131031/55721_1 /ASSEMBLY_ACC=CAM_ASM_000606 /TAXON_ID=109239 /ORGANISM="Alexandrium margalefi, Strain AMGDE01CS-322" /LENGTH=485 /DNA_ID=CAMNT_0051611765 /DNA_START=47 /DNA_END=1501 /DNA_ORIENTATION=+
MAKPRKAEGAGLSEAERMEEEMRVLRDEKQLAGSSLLPFLHWLGMQIFSSSRYKEAYWALFFLCLFFVGWLTTLVMLVAGLLATLASYRRPPRPPGIPLAPPSLDVLLGRPTQVSEDVPGLHSNNNVTIARFRDRYVLAYRQSDVHFPSGKTRIVVAHSTDLVSWKTEWTYANGCDLREVLLFEMGSRLLLYFFSLKPAHGQFKPLHVFYTASKDGRSWADPQQVCYEGEVPWEIKVYGEGGDAVAYKSSYLGDHYGTKDVLVLFEQSRDGLTWGPVAPCTDSSTVHRGGVSEVSFEFTKAGDLVALGRNEDGDATGFGTQLFYARRGSLGAWTPLKVSLPWRFDSPRLASTSGGEILLFARYAPAKYQLTPDWVPFMKQKVLNLVCCSLLPKGAAVYRLAPWEEWGERGEGAVQLVRCFEQSVSDTGFFSVISEKDSDADGWVVANYTSTACHSHAPWIYGQMMPSHVFVFRCRALDASAGAAG